MPSNSDAQEKTIQPDLDASWYLAATKPRQELRAVEQLTNQGIRAFCPIAQVEKIKQGKRTVIEEALFAGYLFINIALDNPLTSKVRSTRGIRDWVRFAGNIAKVPQDLIEMLINEEKKSENKVVISRFNKGESVRILSGPFVGLKGIYERGDGEARSLVLVEFLGQKNQLKLANEQITTD